MLIFLDESFRVHDQTQRKFGVLSGVAIPEDLFAQFLVGVWDVRRPYHDQVLQAEHEIQGKELLGKSTERTRVSQGFSYQWNLAEELLHYARSLHLKVFGVVCFRDDLHSFVCGEELRLDVTYQYLFERIDRYMKLNFARRHAKLVFDNREHRTHEKNARAITNFFVRSQIGLGYDSIVRVPFFAVSQGHNYGLQVADLITTVIAMRFQGKRWIDPLWRIVQDMLYFADVGGRQQSSLKVMKNRPEIDG